MLSSIAVFSSTTTAAVCGTPIARPTPTLPSQHPDGTEEVSKRRAPPRHPSLQCPAANLLTGQRSSVRFVFFSLEASLNFEN